MIKSGALTLLLLLSSASGFAAESITVCGDQSTSVASKDGPSRVWAKVDLKIDLEKGYISYDRYIGIIGDPTEQSYRELTKVERIKLTRLNNRDSGKLVNLQELDSSEAIYLNIDPEEVQKFYMGETSWTKKRGFLIQLKNGKTLFSSGALYSTAGEHCQQFLK
ncbi:hypothetical protein [Bdellovibrio bacteriovorus]|nr:hypothetical protein [Bdellovibrio bacteriovorus]